MDADLDRVKKILLKANNILCDNLAVSDILRKLKAEEVLKPGEVTTIKSQTTDEDKVEKLLDILRRKPVVAYEAFMDCLKADRQDLYNKVKMLEDEFNYKSSGSPSSQTTSETPTGGQVQIAAELITELEITEVVQELTMSELKSVYEKLGLKYKVVEKAEAKEPINDPDLKARSVLREWRQINGNEATKEKIIVALKDCNLKNSMEALQAKWKISL